MGSEEPHRPIDRGFDECYGLMDGCCNYFDPSKPDPPFKGGRVRHFAHNEERITDFPDDYYTTDAFSDHAAEMIREYEDSDQPFFLHVAYTAPHYPLHAKPRDIAKYEGRYTVGWNRIRKRRHQRQVEMGLVKPEWTLPEEDPKVTPWAEQGHKPYMDRLMAVYAAMVHSMDRGIGRILQALDETHQDDETIVLFLSDNGASAETPGGIDTSRIPGPKEHYTAVGPGWAFAQDTPFRRYKKWCHEGGIATPLIVRYPGEVEPGSSTDQVGHVIDFMPTFLELAGVEYPATYHGHELRPLEGKSLMPILRGEERAGHETLYWHWAGNRAARSGRWKAVWGKDRKEWELYDMVADRTETHNLAEQYPDRVESLAAGWKQWAKKTDVIREDD
jgi:arylsulfatase